MESIYAKTPFEQEGRPTRLEWQNGLEFPLVEGISQNLITIVPASEFVLSAVAQLNLYIYPELNHKPVQLLKDIVKFSMDESDRQILERSSPSAMRVHRGTHSMSLGLQWDNYYKSGFGWNMRFLYERPFLSSESHLSSWFSLALGVGYAL
ncbi:MAG: hypothetical protein NTX25_02495 [Proteobacteria bacterium]|nr:hypothetical protein [Pseudomonadota bacterium]